MKHLSLFNGFGGFQIAAQWMGWENVFSCEIDPFCNRVTKHHFPNTIQHEDIRETDFSIYRERIDILSGGFPCQPYSTAGLRKGKEDERHLWPEMLRAIREVSPRWVVGENVRGLISWNGGMVFDEVQADLEAEGYEVAPFLLPAAGVNAPHERYRIWFVAHRSDAGAESMRESENSSDGFEVTTDANSVDDDRSGHGAGKVSQQQKTRIQRRLTEHPNGKRCKEFVTPEIASNPGFNSRGRIEDWSDWPTQPPICTGNDGFPSGLVRQYIIENSGGVLTEKEINHIVQKAHDELRKESVKAAGNAIVPQVAYQIFKAIQQSLINPLIEKQ